MLGRPGSGGAAPNSPHLVEAAAVPGEAPELALQVDDAGFPPDHLDPHLVVLLLQLADLLPVLVLLNQALCVLGLGVVPGMEGLPWRRTRPLSSHPEQSRSDQGQGPAQTPTASPGVSGTIARSFLDARSCAPVTINPHHSCRLPSPRHEPGTMPRGLVQCLVIAVTLLPTLRMGSRRLPGVGQLACSHTLTRGRACLCLPYSRDHTVTCTVGVQLRPIVFKCL